MHDRYKILVMPKQMTTIPTNIADYLHMTGTVSSLMVNVPSRIPEEESSEEEPLTLQVQRCKKLHEDLDLKSLIQEFVSITATHRPYTLDEEAVLDAEPLDARI